MCRPQLIVIIAGVLFFGNSAQAGFYDPRTPTSPLITSSGVRAMNPDRFRDELDKLTAIADPLKPKGPRVLVVHRRDTLLARGHGTLNPNELAELGVLQWRLRDGDAALTSLREAANRDPRNFWALTGLGSVLQSTGQLREALPSLEAARDVLPEPWPSGNPAGDWFKQAEKYQFKLLRLRLRDEMDRRPGSRPVPAADVDNLFDVRFSGPDAKYDVGKIAESERAKLPSDAVAIVQQLLLWFPEDARLLWLLGELYNATGNLEAASRTLDQCVWSRRYESPTLREHRRIVQEAYDAQTKAADAAEQAPASPPRAKILPGGWQLYTVAGIFGILFLALAYWQIGEWVRRMRGPKGPGDS
jgi:tetratricopeptide (TPR) repeat protein